MKKETGKLLIIAIVMTAVFVLFTVLLKMVDVAPVGPLLSKVGFATVNAGVAAVLGYHHALYVIATVFGIFCLLIAAGFALMGAAQLVNTKDIRRVNHRILAVGALYVCVALVYLFFEFVVINYRPVVINDKLSPSYPSSHTMIALCITVSAAMVLKGVLKNRRLAMIIGWACIGLGVLTVLFRFLSGAHWLTDIVGGLLASAMLLCWFAWLLAVLRKGLGHSASRG